MPSEAKRPLLESVVDSLSFTVPLDPWMSLKALSDYSGLPVRALRVHLSDPIHPLPHFRMKEPHVIHEKGRLRTVTGKILIRKSEFDLWMQHFRHVAGQNVDAMVDSLLRECTEGIDVPRSRSGRTRRVKGDNPQSKAS